MGVGGGVVAHRWETLKGKRNKMASLPMRGACMVKGSERAGGICAAAPSVPGGQKAE